MAVWERNDRDLGGAQSRLKRVKHALGKILGTGVFVPVTVP